MSILQTYFRVIRYAKPYWKHVSASIVSTVLYSIFNGVSIYLFIPLLDILFHPEKMGNNQPVPTMNLPFALSGWFENLKNAFLIFIFGGTQMEALLKICIIILGAFA